LSRKLHFALTLHEKVLFYNYTDKDADKKMSILPMVIFYDSFTKFNSNFGLHFKFLSMVGTFRNFCNCIKILHHDFQHQGFKGAMLRIIFHDRYTLQSVEVTISIFNS